MWLECPFIRHRFVSYREYTLFMAAALVPFWTDTASAFPIKESFMGRFIHIYRSFLAPISPSTRHDRPPFSEPWISGPGSF